MSGAASRPRIAWRRVDGVLLLDKPAGVTSNAVLQRMRRLFAAEKAGHTGTLDPAASGLLPICFGEATKFAGYLLDATKAYRATIRFGTATTTGDADGGVIAVRPVAFDRAALCAALAQFRGAIEQVPPRHSALKFKGRPYYEYARADIEIPRVPRRVTIDALELVGWQPPDAVVDVVCSKGTYVRTLAEDLGATLGCGAHLAALRRTRSGGFEIADALAPESLDTRSSADRDRCLGPVDTLLTELERIELRADEARALRLGQPVAATAADGVRYRAYDEGGALLGVVCGRGGRIEPVRLIRTDAASGSTAGGAQRSV